jgi:hypothetical protein
MIVNRQIESGQNLPDLESLNMAFGSYGPAEIVRWADKTFGA